MFPNLNNKKILLPLFLFIAIAIFAFGFAGSGVSRSPELSFQSFSPAGILGGIYIPASHDSIGLFLRFSYFQLTPDSIELLWSSDAKTCTATGDWGGSKPPEGSELDLDLPLLEPRTYSLSCEGPVLGGEFESITQTLDIPGEQICHPEVGDVCDSAANSCGLTNFVRRTCGGSCPSVGAPLDAQCFITENIGLELNGTPLTGEILPGGVLDLVVGEEAVEVSVSAVEGGVEISWDIPEELTTTCSVTIGETVGEFSAAGFIEVRATEDGTVVLLTCRSAGLGSPQVTQKIIVKSKPFFEAF